MATHVISAEEKALLDMIRRGYVITDGRYVKDSAI